MMHGAELYSCSTFLKFRLTQFLVHSCCANSSILVPRPYSWLGEFVLHLLINKCSTSPSFHVSFFFRCASCPFSLVHLVFNEIPPFPLCETICSNLFPFLSFTFLKHVEISSAVSFLLDSRHDRRSSTGKCNSLSTVIDGFGLNNSNMFSLPNTNWRVGILTASSSGVAHLVSFISFIPVFSFFLIFSIFLFNFSYLCHNGFGAKEG